MYQKQSAVYNGYGPTETTLGAIFGSEVLPPPEFSTQEKYLTLMAPQKHHCGLQNPLKIFNVYGPAEAYIVSAETVITERYIYETYYRQTHIQYANLHSR